MLAKFRDFFFLIDLRKAHCIVRQPGMCTQRMSSNEANEYLEKKKKPQNLKTRCNHLKRTTLNNFQCLLSWSLILRPLHRQPSSSRRG